MSKPAPDTLAAKLQAQFEEAIALHQQGQLARAQAIYKNVLKARPRHFDALHLLGVIATQTNQHRLAVDLIGQAIAINPNDAVFYSNRSFALQQLKQLEAAVASCDQAIAIKPDYAEAHYNRGNMLQDLKRLDAAVASYNKAIAIKPNYAEAHSNRGNALLDLKQLDAAVASYDKAIAVKPDYAEAYYNRGNERFKKGDMDGAIVDYDAALISYPRWASAYIMRGSARYHKGDLDGSILDFTKAIEINPHMDQAYYNRGKARTDKGDLDGSINDYSKAIEINPKAPEAYVYRILTLREMGNLGDALFSTIHEAGHAMYEQGIRRELEGTPLARGTSSGVHESQSRLWENLVGRGRGFWRFFYPKLQAVFPAQLGSVPLDTFYRAINKVERSLIRTDADEVTYNLHVMIRFDLECDLLEGRLAIKDLPAAWHARYKSDLGLQAPDDRDGVLQDVHWFAGPIGGQFQGYTLGNILSAQFFDSACRAHPSIPAEITQGRFGTLHGWLRENIYRDGTRYTPEDLVKRVTGGPIGIEPYMKYLWGKYGPLYGLEAAGALATSGR